MRFYSWFFLKRFEYLNLEKQIKQQFNFLINVSNIKRILSSQFLDCWIEKVEFRIQTKIYYNLFDGFDGFYIGNSKYGGFFIFPDSFEQQVYISNHWFLVDRTLSGSLLSWNWIIIQKTIWAVFDIIQEIWNQKSQVLGIQIFFEWYILKMKESWYLVIF